MDLHREHSIALNPALRQRKLTAFETNATLAPVKYLPRYIRPVWQALQRTRVDTVQHKEHINDFREMVLVALFKMEVEARGRTFDPMSVAVARSVNLVDSTSAYEQALETRMAARRRTQHLARRPNFQDTREYVVYGVPFSESRDRFTESWEIIHRAWTEEVFSYDGKFWSYQDVAIWPRPMQEPHPPVWIPVTGSKESIEWAAAHNFPITPGLAGSLGFRQDMVRYYAKCLSEAGHTITPDHLIVGVNAYVADSREAAFDESGAYQLYFNRTLFSHGNVLETDQQRRDGYLSENAEPSL